MILARDGKALFTNVNPWSQINSNILKQQNNANQSYFFVNLESPVEDVQQSQPSLKVPGYDLCADVGQLSVLKQGGVSLVNLANNHKEDCGANRSPDTRQLIEQNGIQSVGPEFASTILDTQAGKIAVIAGEDVTQPVDVDALLKAVAMARSQSDFLIVSMHWGNEYQNGANQRQRDLAQKLADAGVDVLWGTHAHVLQPMGWMNSSDGSSRMLVMFNLGNLLADQWMTSETQQSALVTIEIKEKRITQVSVLPIQLDHASRQLVLPDAEVTQSIEANLGINELIEIDLNNLNMGNNPR